MASSNSGSALSDAFLAAASDESHDDALEARLEAICFVASTAWPDFDIPRETFVAYLGRCADEPLEVGDDALAEIYLACGCSREDRAALALFDARYMDAIPAFLGHMKLSRATIDEVRQLVRHKLLVSEPGQAPKLDAYAGRGKLRGLVQVVATRTALTLLRQQQRERPAQGDALMQLPSPEHDPELHYMKERYRGEFAAAFEEAARELTSRDRNLLRLHLLDGVALEALAGMYEVHRATVVRWLAKTRQQLLSDTRRILRTRLQIDADEFASLMRLIESRLDVSVHRLLRTSDGSATDRD